MFIIENKATLKNIQVLVKIASDKTTKNLGFYGAIKFESGTATVTNGKILVRYSTGLAVPDGNYSLQGNVLLENKRAVFPDYKKLLHKDKDYWTVEKVDLTSELFLSGVSAITGHCFSRTAILANELEKLLSRADYLISYRKSKDVSHVSHNIQIETETLLIFLGDTPITSQVISEEAKYD